MGLKRLFKKVGKVVKKALPFAAMAAPFIPGVGGFIGKGLGAVTGKLLGGSAMGAKIGAGIGRAVHGIGGMLGGGVSSAKGLFSPEILAGVGGDIYSAKQMRESAQDQMAFQERMSSTAHQRETADLRAAGLNPILSGTGGGGASSPGGAGFDVPNFGDRLGSALQLKLQKAQIDNVNASTQNTHAQTAQTVQATAKEAAGKPYWDKSARLDVERKIQEIDNLETSERLTASQAHRAQVLLKDILQDRQLRDYIQSTDYAERKAFNRVLTGDADATTLSRVLRTLKEFIK